MSQADQFEAIKEEANRLAGRELDVEQLKNGEYVISWFSFQHAPPPSAPTVLEAYQTFIDYMNKLKGSENDTEDDRA